MNSNTSRTIFLMLALLAIACAACNFGCAKDQDDSGNDDNNDSGDDDSNDDDDDSFPFIAAVDPLQWKRYSCPAQPREGITIVTGNFNIHGGKEGSPEEIGRALAAYGPFDMFSLQECPEEYAQPIAEELSMYFFYAEEQSLMSATPLIDPQRHEYAVAGWGRFLHATVEIKGREVSVYGVHVNWDDVGDLQNRELVDDYLALDPVERILLMGDWNEELGSTQARILDECLADTWASLGVCPSCRTTWPAVMFYGAEGQQLIDNTYFNKSSGGCAVDGEIIHLTPNRSDHKPQTTSVFFPDTVGFVPPLLLDVVYGLGPESIGLLFDKPLADAQVELYAGDTEIELSHLQIIGEGTLVQVVAAHALPTGIELTARVLSAVDLDGAQTTQILELSFPLYENLVENPGAELGEPGWTLDGMEPSSGFNHVLPLAGDSYFCGSLATLQGRAEQMVPLADFAEVIDAGHGLLVFGGASATGYRIEEGGTSNILLPHDEGEGVVELLDEQGNLLKHISGRRFDVMYWQPWRVTDTIPPGTRFAKIILRAVAGEMPLTFNSTSFDALHLSVVTLDKPHELVGGNLVANPLFEDGRAYWNIPAGVILAKDHFIPIRSNVNVNTATGDYWLGAFLVAPEAKTVSQVIPLTTYADRIAAGKLALQWGSYLRTWNPRSNAVLRLSFLGDSGELLQSDELGPVNIPEWFQYSKTTAVPTGAVAVHFEWIAAGDSIVAGVISFFDAPWVYPLTLE
ncbi:MAG: hypothetical protein P9M14_08560 [Candidatus Alcyoniella australis]|nr:hypothetical protein [Candidatus Alcyoniella australis]